MEDNQKKRYSLEELEEKYLSNKRNPTYNKTKKIAEDYNMVTTFLITIILFVLIGVVLGRYVDQRLGTTPLFIIIFVFLGIGAAYRNLFKAAVKNNKKENK